jgi:hypothetical protein
MCEKQTIIRHSVLQSNPYSVASEVTVVLWTRIICMFLVYHSMLLRISLFWDVTLHHCVNDCPCFRRNIVRPVAKIKTSRNFWIFALFWRNVMPSDSRARGPRIVLVPGDPWRQSKRREPLHSNAASSQENETLKNPCIITTYWHEIWGSDGGDMKITSYEIWRRLAC